MTVETLEKRIEGKKKEIEKLEKKLARIIKAKESGWKVNPYFYNEYELKRTERYLAEAKETLAKYQGDLVREVEKDNSRNVKAVLDFLNMWADRVYAHYEAMFPKYLEAKAEYYRKDREYCEKFNHRQATAELKAELWAARKEFHEGWRWIAPYETRNGFDGEKLKKELEQDKKAKYDDMIRRTNAIVGTITDASMLSVGAKGELNGVVIGERGKARVETIGAGGYNIQCFHFRTLIHKVK